MAVRSKITVSIGSKLPVGVLLANPLNPLDKVEIKGTNSGIKGPDGRGAQAYVVTDVSTDFWDAWKIAHIDNNNKDKTFGPVASGAIFEIGEVTNAESIYREREREMTGMEPKNTAIMGVKTMTKD